ncbi:DMT family transporter [Pokkaliibacter sp. CJK22405]|uniref:DMT family transporter n=1 Tax=Pokkaliibacter sp. CJK22405 TaxID=3384615 RepID=UPI0039855279
MSSLISANDTAVTSVTADDLSTEKRRQQRAVVLGFIAVASFAMTLPATKVLAGQLSPLAITVLRIIIASLVAVPLLWLGRAPLPSRRQWWLISHVLICNNIGFPVLIAVGMNYLPVSHGALTIALLPLATASCAALINGMHPPHPKFWGYACSGAAIVLGYNLWQSGANDLYWGDLALIGAVILCGCGYSQGALLSQKMPGWQVSCWSNALGLPLALGCWWVMEPSVWLQSLSALDAGSWCALLYVGLVSSLLGFFAWNRALAEGGVARISQIQLLQPFFTYGYAMVLFDEPWQWMTGLVAASVLALLWLARR